MAVLTTISYTVPDAADGLGPAVDLRAWKLVAISMPADWSAADLTFQGSADGTTYWNLYESDDAEVTVQAAEDRFIAFSGAEKDFLTACPYLKIRSGTSGTPVDQNAARVLTLVVESRDR